jgi:glycosyltransferase involved in cell wall biosynthesis
MQPLNVLTWHVHGNYLFYLSQVPHRFYLPVKEGKPEGYGGRLPGMPWPDNVVDVPAERVPDLDLDVVLFQSRKNYLEDRAILSDTQQRLPRIFLEHDPPRESPTDTKHAFDDPDGLLVHVTAFNDLMWDNGRTPTRVIEHGVIVPDDVHYTGEIERGLVVVNGLPKRGRRLGADVFEAVRKQVPLDLVGLGAEAVGGLGEVGHSELPSLMARYRFFFNPIRYTSLGLAVCEAMTVGMPIVALATTEMATVVENDVSGYADTSVDILVERMRRLLEDPSEAARLGAGARRTAERRFNIERFVRDWNDVLDAAVRGTRDNSVTDPVHAARRVSAHA